MFNLFDVLFPPRIDEKVIRHTSDDDFMALLAPRLAGVTRPGTVVLLPFSDTRVRSAIHEAKYHGSTRAFKLLGSALAEYLRDVDDRRITRSNLVMLVPVPLGKKRQKERGYNQVEEIVKRVSKELGIPTHTTLLVRTRETSSQVSLSREKREANMRHAFATTHVADPAYTYIVIDDVLTTGATLQAAIDALRAAGAEHIIPLALAH